MSNLSVSNPLDDNEVLITVTVLTGASSRELRPIVVTVGIPEKQVTMRSGAFSQMTQLINQAWSAYAQYQVAAATAVPAAPELEELDIEPVAVVTAVAPQPKPSFAAYSDDAL